jgi:hypothetical protein
MVDATGRIVGWIAVLALVFVTLRGSLPTYLSYLGV